MGLMNYVKAIDVSVELVLLAVVVNVIIMTTQPRNLNVTSLIVLNLLTLLIGLVALRYALTEIEFKLPVTLAVTTIILYITIVTYSVMNGLKQLPNVVGATGVIIAVMTLIKLRGDIGL